MGTRSRLPPSPDWEQRAERAQSWLLPAAGGGGDTLRLAKVGARVGSQAPWGPLLRGGRILGGAGLGWRYWEVWTMGRLLPPFPGEGGGAQAGPWLRLPQPGALPGQSPGGQEVGVGRCPWGLHLLIQCWSPCCLGTEPGQAPSPVLPRSKGWAMSPAGLPPAPSSLGSGRQCQ